MSPKTRKHHGKRHENKPRETGHHSNDVDDSTRPADQSSAAEAFVSDSNVSLKDQPDDHKQLLDVAHPLQKENSRNLLVPSADHTVSSLESHLSLSGSASETNSLIVEADANSYQSLELDDQLSRNEEYNLSSSAFTEVTAAAAVGGSDSGLGGASERLMLQIDSFLRDSEFITPYKPKLGLEELELNHSDDNVPEPFLKLETGPETPEMSATDTGNTTMPDNDANHKVYRSPDAEELSEVEPMCNLATADFFIAENENLDNLLKLLHRLKEICCNNGYYESEYLQHICLNTLQQNEDNSEIGQDGLNLQDDQCDASSVQTEADDLEDSVQTTREEIKQLMLSVAKVLDKLQFSSAVELTQFLEVVQEMRVEIDQWCHSQKKTRTASSEDNEDSTALDSASGGARSFDAIVFLRTKPSQVVTHLSDSLVLWQDFIEFRAELKHELALEHDLLNSVQTNISCNETPRTKLEAENDLRLLEDKMDEYDDKLATLRKCNWKLAKVLDPSTFSSHLEQTAVLANELQDVKDSCSDLRSILNHASSSDEMLSTTQMTIENENSSYSSYAQTEKSEEDFDRQPVARVLLKMALLLFLIILLLLFVISFEPSWYRPLNRFRLPVPIHVRHVGTYPPI